MKHITFISISIIVILGLVGCKKDTTQPVSQHDYTLVATPAFSADSAFSYISKQVNFGPRTPESVAHTQCVRFFEDFFSRLADTIHIQKFPAQLYNGKKVTGTNIIASFLPNLQNRILLAAHWDSRLWADQDPDSNFHKTPIDGANDGASGVGILMEMARLMHHTPPPVGVDIILFDLEDQGKPEWDNSVETNYQQTDWCIGAQYWSSHKHLPFYQPMYGILLDMVGYKEPIFTKEEQSMFYAAGTMNKIWTIAKQLGYGNIFQDVRTGSIMDDHVFVNKLAKIPMIDIVQHSSNGSFFPYWHTQKDNMENISPKTLEIVGKVLLTAIYSERKE